MQPVQMPNESTRARVTEASGRECPLTFQCAAGEGGVHACLQLSCFSFGAISHARAHTRTSTCTCTRTQNALAVLTAVNFVGLLCTYPIPEPRFAPARTQIHTHTHTHTHTQKHNTHAHTHTHTQVVFSLAHSRSRSAFWKLLAQSRGFWKLSRPKRFAHHGHTETCLYTL